MYKINEKIPLYFFSILYLALIITTAVFATINVPAYLYGPFYIWVAISIVYFVVAIADWYKGIQIFRYLFFIVASISAVLFVASLILLANNLAVDKTFYVRKDNSRLICVTQTVFLVSSMLANGILYWAITGYVDSKIDYDAMLAHLVHYRRHDE